MKDKNTFQKLVKREMTARGWKSKVGGYDSKRLAEASGVSPNTVSRFLAGTVVNLKSENLYKISSALGLIKSRVQEDEIIKYPPWDDKRRDIEMREMVSDLLMILRAGTPEMRNAVKLGLRAALALLEKKK